MKNSDTQLIHRVLNGDENAFSALVKKYQKQVHALAWRKIGDFHIAEEITQDTFLRAYQKLRTLKKPQRFASWLYVIATNRCNTWLHKKHFRAQLLKNKSSARPEKASYSEYLVEENERISVETQREVVKKLLAKLEESERTVMTLHYFAEMSCTEIGAFLGVSTNTVKSRLRRARQRLKQEEPVIREALDNFQISPNLTEIIMRKVSQIKFDAPFSSKPLVPWAVAASTLAVILLMLGFGNRQYLARFQKPYSLDVTSEMTVEIIDTPIVANLESKIDVRTQIGRTNAVGKRNNPELQPNEAPATTAEAQTEETVKDWTQWELPEKAKARLGKGGINVLQFSPDGTQLAVGSNIGVWLYDVETGKEMSMFPGMCQSLAFSPDGRFLAHGGNRYRGGEALQLWEVATRRKMDLPARQFSASVLQFSEDGKTLISLANHGDSIRHLDIDTKKGNVKKIKDQSSHFSPAPEALTYDKFAVGRKDGRIELWDTITGEKLFTLSGHAELSAHSEERAFSEGLVLALAFSPDGTQLASGGGDTTVRLWNATSNDEPTILHQYHEGWVNVLAFSPDGKILASGSTDKTVLLSDTTTGKLLAALTGHINGITALTFSPDGSRLASASADGTVRFWDIQTGKSLATRINGHSQWIKAATFLKENSTLVSAASNGIITFWDLKTPQNPTLQMGGHRDWFRSLVFSPDGTRIASIGVERANMIFKGGSAVLTSTTSDNLIRLTDTRTGHEVTLKETDHPSILTFSPDGKMLAFSSSDKIRLWHTETGHTLDIPFFDPNDHPELSYHPEISALVFSPVRNELVSAVDTGKVQVWDTETGAALATLLAGQNLDDFANNIEDTALTFSPDGTLLAVGSNQRIRLFGSEKYIALKEEIPHNSNVLIFSPDNGVLVNGRISGEIQLWDAITGNKLTTLIGHTTRVETLKFSPDGKTIVSTGTDGTILLWDWEEVLKGAELKKISRDMSTL